MHGSRKLLIGIGLKYTLDLLMTKPATDQYVAGSSCRSVDRTLITASPGMVDSFVAGMVQLYIMLSFTIIASRPR